MQSFAVIFTSTIISKPYATSYLMRRIAPINCLFLLTCFCTQASLAQSSVQDSSFRSAAIQNMVDLYHKTTGSASNLYNGPQYESYYPGFEKTSHQFFLFNDFTPGSVLYDGVLYKDVPLMYDLVRDELVLRHLNNSSWITLVKEKIESFTLQDHHFRRLKRDNKLNLPEGFYSELYVGNIMLLGRYQKIREEYIDQRTVFSKAISRTHYYVIKDGKTLPVKNKKTLLNVLEDKKSYLSQFIKQNDLSFKKNLETAMVQTVKHYDQSTR